MKTKIIVIIFLFVQTFVFGQKQFFVANYNLQNLFDTINDPNKNDEEFLPDGSKKWTNERLDKKLYNLSRAIRYMNNIQGPDLLGVEEVEHRSVLDTMINRYFCDKNYKVAYLESPDKRGIDAGLIYNANIFTPLSIKGLKVELPSHYPTRLILKVHFKMSSGDSIFVFVNHWPSRRGGSKKSAINRITAANVLKTAVAKLQTSNPKVKIIIIGDFNDEPYNTSIAETLGAKLYNPETDTKTSEHKLYNLAAQSYRNGKGTFLYRSQWNMLDQIIINGNLMDGGKINYRSNSFRIINPYFIRTHSGKYKGASFPTYGGWKYLGGYSDHFAVGALFNVKLRNKNN